MAAVGRECVLFGLEVLACRCELEHADSGEAESHEVHPPWTECDRQHEAAQSGALSERDSEEESGVIASCEGRIRSAVEPPFHHSCSDQAHDPQRCDKAGGQFGLRVFGFQNARKEEHDNGDRCKRHAERHEDLAGECEHVGPGVPGSAMDCVLRNEHVSDRSPREVPARVRLHTIIIVDVTERRRSRVIKIHSMSTSPSRERHVTLAQRPGPARAPHFAASPEDARPRRTAADLKCNSSASPVNHRRLFVFRSYLLARGTVPELDRAGAIQPTEAV